MGDKKILAVIFLFFGMVYFISAKGYMQSSDSVFSLKTADALFSRGTFAIEAAAHEKDYVFETVSGKKYSKYGIGLALVWLPIVAVAKALAIFTAVKDVSIMDFLISFYNIGFGAGTCVLLFLMLRLYKVRNEAAVSVVLCFGLATMCWRYSVWELSEATQMFFLLLAVYGVLRNTSRSIRAASGAWAALILLKVVYLAFFPLFLAYVFTRNRSGKKICLKTLAYFLLAPCVAVLLVCLLNQARFGNIFETGYGRDAFGFSFANILQKIGYLLFSFDKGVFIYSPVLLAATFGIYEFMKVSRRDALFFISIIAAAVLLFASWHSAGGGWSWGPRFLVPFIPLWLFPVYLVFEKGKFARAIMVILILASSFIQIISVLQSGQEYHHIRYTLAASGNQHLAKEMPADIIGTAILLKHKLFTGNNLYRSFEFGIASEDSFDTSSAQYYKELNLWYYYVARRFHKPFLRLVPFVFLPLVMVCLFKLFSRAKTLDALQERAHGTAAVY
ncbi:MAG: hypothetical protein WDL87_00850 [Candidatus Omnitrophota bacterium]|jgi:hypothetical protein